MVPESRNAAFQGGATGTGLNHATSIQQTVPEAFHPSSVLALPNVLKTPNGKASNTYQATDPYDSSMRGMLKEAAAGGGYSGVMNV